MLKPGHMHVTRCFANGFAAALLLVGPMIAAAAASAQVTATLRSEDVSYYNPHDSTLLGASLVIPTTRGPHPGVVLLSVAGTDPLVARLVAEGYAVLTPVRRGFVAVEPLLRARYADLAEDARAALAYLGARPEVDGGALALVAQADDAPPAMLLAASADDAVPLILLAPPAFTGRDVFRLEQLGVAAGRGADGSDLQALGAYVEQIVDVVLADDAPYLRQYRLEGLRAGSSVQLPYNAAFPDDERQMHFFASPLWHDRMAFEPEKVLARMRTPVLVLIGTEDHNTPVVDYLDAVRRGFASATSPDTGVCLLPGRTRHSFTPDGVRAIVEWLAIRRAGATDPRLPAGCLPDEAVR
jgi:hypothetical protein